MPAARGLTQSGVSRIRYRNYIILACGHTIEGLFLKMAHEGQLWHCETCDCQQLVEAAQSDIEQLGIGW